MPALWPRAPGEDLFMSAKQAFDQKSYADALRLYEQYIVEYPQSPRVPEALVNTGRIHLLQGDDSTAEAIFHQVQNTYPGTGQAKQAGVELLATYYFQGRYEQVERYAKEVLSMKLSGAQRFRATLIAGDASLALKSPRKAYKAFLTAFEYAGGSERAQVLTRLKTAIALLDPAFIGEELQRLERKPPAGYLLYQQGVDAMEQGNLEEAESAFSRLADEFPEHEYAGRAKQMIEKIKAAGGYEKDMVGCLLPLSGRYKPFGTRALNGIELALSEYYRQTGNAAIKLIIRDTASDPDQAAAAARELADMKVSAIIGPMMTPDAVVNIAQEAGIPIITLTQKPGITDAGDCVFRNFLTPKIQVKTLLSYAQHLGMKRFAILYPQEEYGKIFMNLFWDEVNALGGRIMGVESYDPAQTDFAVPIKKLVGLYYEIPEDLKPQGPAFPLAFKGPGTGPIQGQPPSATARLLPGLDSEDYREALLGSFSTDNLNDMLPEKREEDEFDPIVDFDAIFIPDSANKAGLIIPQLSYYDVSNVVCLGTNLWHSDKFIDMVRYHPQREVFTDGFFGAGQSAPVAAFVMAYKATYGAAPGFIEGVGYDTGMILFRIISRPEVHFRSQVKTALLQMAPFEGVTGRTAFAPNGEAVKQIYLLTINRNRFAEIPSGSIEVSPGGQGRR